MKEILLKWLTAFFAFALAGAAAYCSVFGLAHLFAGASFSVIIIASILEGAKLISASILHTFNDRLPKILRAYLASAVIVLMIITSVGIYGYLTNAYQSTSNQLEIIDKQTAVLDMKRSRFNETLIDYKAERTQLATAISELTKGLSNNVIEYKDKETGQIIRTTSSTTRKVLQGQLNDAKLQRDKISIKMEALTDSITKLDLQILDLSSNEELAAEIGPLKYIAELTGVAMNRVINWVTLALVFVFDPLAVMLIIVLNRITDAKPKDDEDEVTLEPQPTPDPDPITDNDPKDTIEDDLKSLPDNNEEIGEPEKTESIDDVVVSKEPIIIPNPTKEKLTKALDKNTLKASITNPDLSKEDRVRIQQLIEETDKNVTPKVEDTEPEKINSHQHNKNNQPTRMG